MRHIQQKKRSQRGFLISVGGARQISNFFIVDAINRRSMFNIIDHASGVKADFAVLKPAPFRQMEFSRKVQVDFWVGKAYQAEKFFHAGWNDYICNQRVTFNFFQANASAGKVARGLDTPKAE